VLSTSSHDVNPSTFQSLNFHPSTPTLTWRALLPWPCLEAKGEKFDPLNYFTKGGDGYTAGEAAAPGAVGEAPVAAESEAALAAEVAAEVEEMDMDERMKLEPDMAM
jgi:hypothetical protein